MVSRSLQTHFLSARLSRLAFAFALVCALYCANNAALAQSGAAKPQRAMTAVSGAADVPTSKKSENALAIEITSIDSKEGIATLRFTLPRAGIVRITLMTDEGKEVGVLASGLSNAGANSLEIEVDAIPAGEYRCILQTRDGNVSTRLVVTR